MAAKRRSASARLSGHKEGAGGVFRAGAGRYHVCVDAKRPPMKPSLHLKIAVVLAYVALCTMLVLGDQQAEAPPQNGQVPTALNYE
jgi:hypothetical protein